MPYFDRSNSTLKPMPTCLRMMMEKGAYWALTSDQGAIELCFAVMPPTAYRKVSRIIFNSDNTPLISGVIIFEPETASAVTAGDVMVILQHELITLFEALFISNKQMDLIDEFKQYENFMHLELKKGFPGFSVRLPILSCGIDKTLLAYEPIFKALEVPFKTKCIKFYGDLHKLIEEARDKFCSSKKYPNPLSFRSAVIHFMRCCLYEFNSVYDVLGKVNYSELEEQVQTATLSNGFDVFLDAFVDGRNENLLSLLKRGKMVLYALFQLNRVQDQDRQIQTIVTHCERDQLARAILAYYFHLCEPEKLKQYLKQHYKINFVQVHDSVNAKLASVCQNEMLEAILGTKESCGKFLDYMKGKLSHDASLKQRFSLIDEQQMLAAVEQYLDDFLSLQSALEGLLSAATEEDEPLSLVTRKFSPAMFSAEATPAPVPEPRESESVNDYSKRMQRWAKSESLNCPF